MFRALLQVEPSVGSSTCSSSVPEVSKSIPSTEMPKSRSLLNFLKLFKFLKCSLLKFLK